MYEAHSGVHMRNKVSLHITISEDGSDMLRELVGKWGMTRSAMVELCIREKYYREKNDGRHKPVANLPVANLREAELREGEAR